jgi:hypothetical protein
MHVSEERDASAAGLKKLQVLLPVLTPARVVVIGLKRLSHNPVVVRQILEAIAMVGAKLITEKEGEVDAGWEGSETPFETWDLAEMISARARYFAAKRRK